MLVLRLCSRSSSLECGIGNELPSVRKLIRNAFELAFESGYLFGVFNPPQDYQIGPNFLTGAHSLGSDAN